MHEHTTAFLYFKCVNTKELGLKGTGKEAGLTTPALIKV